MTVTALDHANIICRDLAETVAFYETVLGMRATPTPHAPPGWVGCWIYDAAGRGVIHLVPYQPQRHGQTPRHQLPNGSMDHIALACTGFEAMIAHCAALNIPMKVNNGQFGAQHQIFITDPNNVTLELVYRED